MPFMDSVYSEKSVAGAKSHTGRSRLRPAEIEAIHLFIRFAAMLGQPRSIAEIYGLLFMSEKPLTMDALIDRLGMSKGSASQGLKYLQDLGAIRTVYVAADRRTHYEVVTELRKLAARFLNQQIQTHFENSETILSGIASKVETLPDEQRKHVVERLELLRRWERSGRRVLPLVLTMLGSE
jgi:HTH-type transcriptional regulator, glycine betaine synthesis regulator